MSTILQGRPSVHRAHLKSSSSSPQKSSHTLNDDVAVLAECRALHGVSGGGPSISLKNAR